MFTKFTLFAGLLAIVSAKPGYQSAALPIATTGYASAAPIATYAASAPIATSYANYANYAPVATSLPLARSTLAYTAAAPSLYGGYGSYGGFNLLNPKSRMRDTFIPASYFAK
ncbi:hypothetical protein QAD02_015955 [Eretmocerus hayati]|uniref:Uncharacterized protein n=1 Tax=Eretmocerus hayati TaxID=131215 RepID=A0ACC2P9P9_9HYME|nr:hypothetical protein QAD02_015955 [Eretmocerus hayati]